MRTGWADPRMDMPPIHHGTLRIDSGVEVTQSENVGHIIETLSNQPDRPIRVLVGGGVRGHVRTAASDEDESERTRGVELVFSVLSWICVDM